MLAISRILILLVPFRFWRHSLGAISANALPQNDAQPDDAARSMRARGIARQVRYAAHIVPFKAVCLPQAMSARWMLLRRGIQTQLFIGAKRHEDKTDFAFHAWLMCGNDCLTGAEEKAMFSAFGDAADLKPELGA